MDGMNYRALLAVDNIGHLLDGVALRPDCCSVICDKMEELRASGFYARYPASETQEPKGGIYG